ncbi:MAG: hypothetical protein ABI162_03970 [Luteolibacter sp.]
MKTSSIKHATRLFLPLIAIAGISTSCVSTKNVGLSAADRAAMRGKTLTVTTREKPHHWVMKQSSAMAAALGGPVGGAIAGGMADKEGSEQVAKHHIANPNDTMTSAVQKDLVAKTGLRPIPSRGITKALGAGEVAKENPHADYVLDCFATAWMGNYYPLSIGKYFVMFGAKMQLVETSTGRVVAEGFSLYQGKDREHAPDYDGIYSNDAAFLKAETKTGTDGAISKFTSQF